MIRQPRMSKLRRGWRRGSHLSPCAAWLCCLRRACRPTGAGCAGLRAAGSPRYWTCSAGREEQGEVLGVSQSVGSLSRVLGPAAAGFFFGEFGRNAAFLWGAVLVGAALLVLFKLTRGLAVAKLTGAEPAEPTR